MKQLLLILSVGLLGIGCGPVVMREYYENGQLWQKVNYIDGEVISEKEWDEEGNPIKDP